MYKLKSIKSKYIAVINYFDGSTRIFKIKPIQIVDILNIMESDKYIYEILLYEKHNDGKYEMINWVHKELDS